MSYKIEIDSDLCKGCSLCIPECRNSVISIGNHFNQKGWQYAVTNDKKECIGCKKCILICPDAAITLKKYSE